MIRRASLVLLAVLAVSACAGSSATPEALETGRRIYGDICSTCHGSAGQGGVGPSLAAVVGTWPSCADQVRWITIGSEGWREQVGDTYGATDKPVLGGMPGHGDRLAPVDIAAVAAWERVTYGGAEREAVLADCGLK